MVEDESTSFFNSENRADSFFLSKTINVCNDFDLVKSDGTASGTVMVKDINSGSGSSDLSEFTVIGNTLYFSADDGINGCELYTNMGIYTEVTYS